jgi:hypothetical protein
LIYEDYDQETLRRLLSDQWESDLAYVQAQGIYPPWQLEPDNLDQAQYRLLAAICDNGGLLWADNSRLTCRNTTQTIGLRAIGNAKKVIADCLTNQWITCKYDDSRKAFMLLATLRGMDMLEDYEDQVEAGIL